MAESTKPPTPSERDEPVKMNLDPEIALRALLKVEPAPTRAESEPETETEIRGPKPRPRPTPSRPKP